MRKQIDLPYMRVNQKGMVFYISKIPASDLREIADFHFREPYKEYVEYKSKDFELLKAELEGSGALIREGDESWSVQRILNRKRVLDIKNYIEQDPEALFPSTVLLAIDTTRHERESLRDTVDMDTQGVFTIYPDMTVSIIDGQHRLAGLFLSNEEIVSDFEIPVVFMLDVSTPIAAKLFQHINGKQRQVNKSVIFDLFDNVPEELIDDEDDLETKRYHTICVNLYTDPASPFYRQIKMLGIGGGAISQAFFIDACKRHLKSFKQVDIQQIYDELFDYFTLVQTLFPKDWPKPVGEHANEEIDRYSRDVLSHRKSQLAKTNGISAMLQLFDWLHANRIGIYAIKCLAGKVDWTKIDGTGAAAQKRLFERLKETIESQMGLSDN